MKDTQLLSAEHSLGEIFYVLVGIEIADMRKFATAAKLHAYAGVMPSTHGSGE